MERKWKVIIVDDEYYVGQLIRKLIPWDELNLECEAVFTSSEEALEKIRTDSIDIVITDIKMPRITGLELIRRTIEMGKHSRFIITSGYREFEYAREAMKYGVDNYILKPVTKENLVEALGHVCRLLEKDAHVETIEKEIDRVSDQQSRMKKNDSLRTAIEQNAGEKKFEPRSLERKGDSYLGLDIKLDYFEPEKGGGAQDEITAEYIFRTVEKYYGQACDDILQYQGRNLHLYILLIYPYGKGKEIKDGLEGLLSSISHYLLNIDLYHVTIGVGREKGLAEKIPDTEEEAFEAVCGRLVYGTESILYHENSPLYQKDAAEEIFEKYRQDIARAIDSFDTDLLSKEINLCFHELNGTKAPNMRGMIDLAEVTIGYFSECAKLEESAQSRQELMDHLDHCTDRQEFVRILSDSLTEKLEQMRQASESQSLKPIRIAKNYIEEHYKEKLTLEEIAGQVGLSPIYLGAVFKKETGQTIGNYLTFVRMNHAKSLLLETNDTVAAIGMEVGYRDQKYFSQTFAKVVGIKPNLYRKLHS